MLRQGGTLPLLAPTSDTLCLAPNSHTWYDCLCLAATAGPTPCAVLSSALPEVTSSWLTASPPGKPYEFEPSQVLRWEHVDPCDQSSGLLLEAIITHQDKASETYGTPR